MDRTIWNLDWGGRRSRYKDTPFRCIEALDPFRRRICRFPDDLHYASWLRFVLTPDTRDLGSEAPSGRAIVEGRLVRTRFDLWVETRASALVLVEVKTAWQLRESERVGSKAWFQKEAQLRVAAAVGAEYQRLGPATVFGNRTYLDNLILCIQALTLYDHWSSSQLESRVLEHLNARGEATVEKVINLSGGTPVEVQVALLRLHQRGRVCVDLGKVPYGGGTRVCIKDATPGIERATEHN